MDAATRTRFVSLVRDALSIAKQEGLTESAVALERAENAAPVVEVDDPRVVVRRLDTFTVTELQHALGRSRPHALSVVKRLVEQGVVRDTGLARKHDGPGRPAPVFQYVPIDTPNRPREKRTPVEVEVSRNFRPARGKIMETGRTIRVTNPDVRKLVDVARDSGCRVENTSGGHIRVYAPDGSVVSLPSTPSDHRSVKNARSKMRRAGIPV